MLDDDTVDRLARHWRDGWNAEDVDVIMAPYAEQAVFSSPFVPRLTGDPARTTIEGRDALRDYVAGALARTPGIRYTLDATFAGTDAVVLVYTAYLPDGSVKRGADSMRVDESGQIVDWRSHYARDSL